MLFTEIQNKLLAVLFAAGEPVETRRFQEALELEPQEAQERLAHLAALLEEEEFPWELRRLGDQWQLCSRPIYGELIRRTLELGRSAPLSPAALEVLAIVAYNQPVTRAFVEQIRGVDCSGVIALLVERNLLEEAGRLDLPGRPISYRTTAAFLRCFGLEDLSQLPPVDPENREQAPPMQPEDEMQLDFAALAAGAQASSPEEEA